MRVRGTAPARDPHELEQVPRPLPRRLRRLVQPCLEGFGDLVADRRSLEVIPGSPPDLRNPPPGCRFAPRCFAAMAVCSAEVPPEISFDGVRVACHLYHEGDSGEPVTTAPADAIGATAAVGVA